MKTVVIRVSW